jgi:prevent-host-death family protein
LPGTQRSNDAPDVSNLSILTNPLYNDREEMPMAQPIRVRNARGELVETKAVSASDAKNVGRILEYVSRDGAVTITRRNEPLAVVVSVETYARLAAVEQPSLDTLTAEFDALLDRMQQPGMARAMQHAFRMSVEQLGRAALEQAGPKAPARVRPAAAKSARARKQRGRA